MRVNGWTTAPAERLAAEQRFIREAGPCPNCGAAADVEVIEAGTVATSHFIAGDVTCSRRCYELEPEGYIAAIKRLRSESGGSAA